MGLVRVRAHGLDDFRRELTRLDRSWGKELRLLHLDIAKFVQTRAVAAARRQHTKRAIKARATRRAARLDVIPKRGDELADILGQKRRSGWYGMFLRYRSSEGRQFRPWVGNQWDPGETAGVPYEIGDAVNDSVDEVIDMYGDMLDRLARRAFPDGVL